jgi:hypothetical protein
MYQDSSQYYKYKIGINKLKKIQIEEDLRAILNNHEKGFISLNIYECQSNPRGNSKER